VPSVTWNPGNSLLPFQMTWMNPDKMIYTMRKPQFRAYWQDERGITTDPDLTSAPSIGAWLSRMQPPSGDIGASLIWDMNVMYVRTPGPP
jgi:hypothetical protein